MYYNNFKKSYTLKSHFPNLTISFGLLSGSVTNNKQIAKAKIASANGVALSLDRYLIFQDQIEFFMQTQNQTRFSIQRMSINMGPVKALSQVMPTITTPIVYLAQDDFALNVNVDAKKVVRTMLNAAMGYNNVRYTVLLSKYYRAKLPTSFYLQRGLSPNATAQFTTNETAQVYPPDADQSRLQAYDYASVCLDDHFTHKVGFFSDNNHFALTELYTKFLLPTNHQKGNKFVEDTHQSLAIHRPQDCTYFERCLYHPLVECPCILSCCHAHKLTYRGAILWIPPVQCR